MALPLLYLDVCTLCRPFDDQSLLRIRLETDSYYLILQAIQDGDYGLLVSPVHLLEVDAIQNLVERNEIKAALGQQGTSCDGDRRSIRHRAEELAEQGMGLADAAHVAFAEVCADYFISCDDRLLKQCRRLGAPIKVMTPVAFCEQEELK
jgi:hypothetical protein